MLDEDNANNNKSIGRILPPRERKLNSMSLFQELKNYKLKDMVDLKQYLEDNDKYDIDSFSKNMLGAVNHIKSLYLKHSKWDITKSSKTSNTPLTANDELAIKDEVQNL